MPKESSTDDKFLLSRAEDCLYQIDNQPRTRFLGWLDGRQRVVLENYLKKRTSDFVFWGGFDSAERTYLALWSKNQEKPREEEYPFSSLICHFRKEDPLTHRDFLGALLHLQIRREAIGDLLVGTGVAVLFLDAAPLKLVENQLTKVGSVGVSVSRKLPEELPKAFDIEEKRIVVASMRLDVLVAAAVNVSRTESAQKIRNGFVNVNYQECYEVSMALEAGTLLSIRGYGRFFIQAILGETKKGRISVLLEKYK